MAQVIQLRRGTATEWTTADPLLAEGELGVELDTYKCKIGDGITDWTALPYATTGSDGGGGMNWIGVWNSGVTYTEGDVVSYSNALWIAAGADEGVNITPGAPVVEPPVSQILQYKNGGVAITGLTRYSGTYTPASSANVNLFRYADLTASGTITLTATAGGSELGVWNGSTTLMIGGFVGTSYTTPTQTAGRYFFGPGDIRTVTAAPGGGASFAPPVPTVDFTWVKMVQGVA